MVSNVTEKNQIKSGHWKSFYVAFRSLILKKRYSVILLLLSPFPFANSLASPSFLLASNSLLAVLPFSPLAFLPPLSTLLFAANNNRSYANLSGRIMMSRNTAVKNHLNVFINIGQYPPLCNLCLMLHDASSFYYKVILWCF